MTKNVPIVEAIRMGKERDKEISRLKSENEELRETICLREDELSKEKSDNAFVTDKVRSRLAEQIQQRYDDAIDGFNEKIVWNEGCSHEERKEFDAYLRGLKFTLELLKPEKETGR